MSLTLGGLEVQPLGLAVGAGVLTSFYAFRAAAGRAGLSPQAGAALHLAATLGALLGARLPAAAEGKLFDPPSEWVLSPSMALLGLLLAADYLRMRMRLPRGPVADAMATAAAPLLLFVSLALAALGFAEELWVGLPPLLALALLAKPARREGALGAAALGLLALGGALRFALGGPAALLFGTVPEPLALAAVAAGGAGLVLVMRRA